MVQAKAKSLGKPLRRLINSLRSPRIYIPWLSQSLRHLRPDLPSLSTRKIRPRPTARQGPMFEILEQRIYMSSLPTPFTNMDIGAPAITGSAIYVSASNQWQATGAGTGVAGTADQFNYTAENWTGSGAVSANVGAVANTGTNAQAGVMIRDTSAAGSEFAAVLENPNGTISLSYRDSAGGAVTVATTTGSAVSPAWVQLSETQSGTTDSFTGLYSTDGVNWTPINTTPINITFTSTTNLAGLAVTSGTAAQSQTVNFNSFSATPASFTDQNIGNPGIAGSATYNPTTGNWTVNGGGGDIWNSSDQFNFASESFSGSGTIIAQVNSQTDTSIWAKAGVMFRNDNTAGSAFADVVVTPGEGVAFQWRSAAGGQCGNVQVAGIIAPVWVKLARSGDYFMAYYSTDGSTWNEIGTVQSVTMNSTALAGLAVTAHNNGAISTAGFSGVAIAAPPSTTSLPAGWTVADIGSPPIAGSAVYDSSNGNWTVNGSGGGISANGDQLSLAGESLVGDGQIVARVTHQSNTGAVSGVTIRDGNTANSAFAAVLSTGNGVAFEYRGSSGGYPAAAQGGVLMPAWVKLVRQGNNFSGYYSTDGSTWTQIGVTETISFSNSTNEIGLMTAAGAAPVLNTGTFTNVSVTTVTTASPVAATGLTVTAPTDSTAGLSWTDPNTVANEASITVLRSTDGTNYSPVATLAPGITSYTDTGLLASTAYWYEVQVNYLAASSPVSNAANITTAASTLPAPWTSGDVGTVPVAGSASYSGGQFTVSGSGNVAANYYSLYYVGAAQDSFQYAYQPLGSNGQITAQINSQTNTGNWAQAGLMMRAQANSGSIFGGIFITPNNGVEFLTRTGQSVKSMMQADISYSSPTSGAPVWVTLTYQNGVLTGYVSLDGINWSQIGQTAINLGSSPTAGLVAASGSSTTTSTATFSNVAVGAVSSFNVVPQMAQSIQTESFSGSDGRITWRPIPGATSITVQQSTDGGSTWSTVSGASGNPSIPGIPGTADTWLPTGLTPNTTYSYRIQAGNANGFGPWSPVVSLTTGSSTTWGMYATTAGPTLAGAGTNSDVMNISTTQSYVYADSWQQAFLRASSGNTANNSLGTSFPIGNFVAASTGLGYYGNSYSLTLSNIGSSPSYSLPANTAGFDDTAAEYYYIGGQNDATSPTGGSVGSGTQPGDVTTKQSTSSPTAGSKSSVSHDPVAFANGSPVISAPGLFTTGFSGNWQVQLNYTTMTQYAANSIYGNGWSSGGSNGGLSYLTGTDSGDPNNENIVIVMNPNSQIVFLYNLTTSKYQAGVNAAGDTITHDTANNTYIITMSNGFQYIYYDLSSQNESLNLQGVLKQVTDAYGNVTSFTYNNNNLVQLAKVTQSDAAGNTETFTYSYINSGVNSGKVALITQSIQRYSDPSPTLYRQMALNYYDGSYTGDMQYGNAGDLRSVTIEDGSGNVINQSIYRYYTPGDALNSSEQQIGFVGGLQYEFGPESVIQAQEAVAAYNAANNTGYDIFSAPSSVMAPYADQYYQYNSNHQVTLQIAAGVGGTVANGQGTYLYAYYQNPNYATQAAQYVSQNPGATSSGDLNLWLTRTTETNPDGSRQIVYTNVNDETLLQMTIGNSDTPISMMAYIYNSQGQVLETINPSAINLNASILNGAVTASAIEAALEPYADLGISEGLAYSNQGLIDSNTYYSPTATIAPGYLEAQYVQQGSAGTPIEQDSYTYLEHQDSSGNSIFPAATYTQYQVSASGGPIAEATTYSYTWQSNAVGVTNQIADLTTTNPVIVPAQNGPGTATTTQAVYNTFGQPVWTMDAAGYINYTGYDNATGAVVQSVQDVNTSNLGDLTNYNNGPALPAGWATPAGGGLNLVTSYYIDDLGRTIERISPAGNITLYVYEDASHAVFTFSGVILDTSTNTLTTTGPITMTRTLVPYNYTVANVTYSGDYTETMTLNANTPISYSIGGINGKTIVPVLPGFIQGTGAVVGGTSNTQPNNVLNLIGNGTIASPQYTIQTLSRSLHDNAGQQVEADSYQSINNATYLATAPGQPYSGSLITNQLSGQAPNGNYYASYMAYDVNGNMYKVVDNNGTIQDTVYDSLGRAVSNWVGTNDATNNGQAFTGSNAGTGNNMTEVSSNVYDGGGVGDGNLTEIVQYPSGNTTGTQQVTLLSYDFRDRLVATETGLTLNSSGAAVISNSDPHPLITVSTLDNLGDVTATLTFNGAATTIANAIVAAASAAPGAVLAGLVGYSTSEYDSQNRDYENQTYSVDPTTGTISTSALTSYTFYGPRGNVIETVAPTGQVTKNVYNGVNELVDTFTTDGGAVNNGGTPVLTYIAAGSAGGDIVINQTAYGYDGDGNLIETVHAQRFNTDPIIGSAAEGALFTDSVNADGSLNVTPASNSNSSLGARIYYSATYYDAADREIATVNAGTNPVGTNGVAAPWTRPVTPGAPGSPVTSLITTYQYNQAGWLATTTDPRGIVAANFYNSLGETTQTIAAYNPSVNGGNPTSSQNQTTDYTYL